jgi:hypothetical protein
MTTQTSIKIKKLWYADVANDGGIGTNWKEIQMSLREATVKFNGSAANVTNYKNVLGSILESARLKGDKTLVFQLADLSPAVLADFTAGTVTTSADSVKYACPENENNSVEKSIKFLTESNLLITLPRVSIDAYPMFNDDDLHYYQMDGVVLLPSKTGVTSYYEEQLLLPDANDILSFVLAAQTGAATINSSAHTVAITVANGTVVTALVPVIGVSVGASIIPESGEAKDFTAPVVYAVESASGIKQNWTVTVTVAP